jgi:hypothetical protein
MREKCKIHKSFEIVKEHVPYMTILLQIEVTDWKDLVRTWSSKPILFAFMIKFIPILIRVEFGCSGDFLIHISSSVVEFS